MERKIIRHGKLWISGPQNIVLLSHNIGTFSSTSILHNETVTIICHGIESFNASNLEIIAVLTNRSNSFLNKKREKGNGFFYVVDNLEDFFS